MKVKPNGKFYGTKLGLGIALLAVLTGCVGYVDGGGYNGVVVAPGPDLYLFGGDYERGRDVRAYSHRGFESRGGGRRGGGGHSERR